jgi:hypothetical protein
LAIDFFIYFWAMYQFSYGDYSGIGTMMSLVFVAGNISAIGITIGHELMHRKQLTHKIFGTLVYSK